MGVLIILFQNFSFDRAFNQHSQYCVHNNPKCIILCHYIVLVKCVEMNLHPQC